MFKPHVTVACMVHAQGKLLVVEERVDGRVTWNQPAGHLEADETLLEAAQRELYEETGISAQPDNFSACSSGSPRTIHLLCVFCLASICLPP